MIEVSYGKSNNRRSRKVLIMDNLKWDDISDDIQIKSFYL
jgi:hypothetical protein